MGFPRQQYWSRLLFPSSGDLPDPGIKPGCPALQADSLPSKSRKLGFKSSHKACGGGGQVGVLSSILRPQHRKPSLRMETNLSYKQLAPEKGSRPLGASVLFRPGPWFWLRKLGCKGTSRPQCSHGSHRRRTDAYLVPSADPIWSRRLCGGLDALGAPTILGDLPHTHDC